MVDRRLTTFNLLKSVGSRIEEVCWSDRDGGVVGDGYEKCGWWDCQRLEGSHAMGACWWKGEVDQLFLDRQWCCSDLIATV